MFWQLKTFIKILIHQDAHLAPCKEFCKSMSLAFCTACISIYKYWPKPVCSTKCTYIVNTAANAADAVADVSLAAVVVFLFLFLQLLVQQFLHTHTHKHTPKVTRLKCNLECQFYLCVHKHAQNWREKKTSVKWYIYMCGS